MHIHIGAGFILLAALAVIAVILVSYYFRRSTVPVQRAYVTANYGSQPYGGTPVAPVGMGVGGIGAGTGFVAGIAAGALLDEAFSHHNNTTIIEEEAYPRTGGVAPMPYEEPTSYEEPSTGGAFFDLDISSDE